MKKKLAILPASEFALDEKMKRCACRAGEAM